MPTSNSAMLEYHTLAAARKPSKVANRRKSKIKEEDKIIILKKFDKYTSKLKNAEKAAKKIGVSASTLYRWKRQIDSNQKYKPGSTRDRSAVNKSINTLIYCENCTKYQFIEVLFIFISWLRWPSELNDLQAAVTVCVTNYVSQNSSASKISELSYNDQQFLFQHIHMDDLRTMVSPNKEYFPYFDRFLIDDQPFDERNYMANIVWIVLGYHKSAINKKSRPSLRNTHYILQKELFQFNWKISLRTFRHKWRLSGAAAAFYFVEEQAHSIKLSVDPNDDQFSFEIDKIFSDRSALITYMRNCKWAVEQMRMQLDPRAFQKLWVPDFPAELEPLPFQIAPLPQAVITLIKQNSALS